MNDHTHAVLDRKGSHANVTFRTEAGLNVASIEFMDELEEVVDELARDKSVRFVLFRAEGKAFLAGANIKAMVDYDGGDAWSTRLPGAPLKARSSRSPTSCRCVWCCDRTAW